MVHTAMANGLLKHGYYTFGPDGKLVNGSYVPFERVKRKKRSGSKGSLSKKKKHLSKRTKKQLILVGSVVLIVVILAVAGYLLDTLLIHPDGPDASDIPQIELPSFDEKVLLCSRGALECYNGVISVSAAKEYGDPYRPLTFEYDLKGKNGVLRYSENADLSNYKGHIIQCQMLKGRTCAVSMCQIL